MAIALTAQRIRCAIDTSNPFGAQLNNLINNAVASLPSGSAINLEFLFYFQTLNDANLLDLTQYSEIVVAICANQDPHSGTIYYQASVDAEEFNSGATVELWNAGTAASAHVQVPIASAANVIPPGNTNYWIVIYGVSTDAAADNILLFATKINTQDSGIPAVNPGAQLPLAWGSYIPFFCSDGLTRNFSLVKNPNGQWTYDIGAGQAAPGVAFVPLKCPDNLRRNLSLMNESGQWTVTINPNGY